MLAVSSLGNNRDAIRGETVDNFSMGADDFPGFGDENLLDCIDFDDLFAGINDGDLLSDLDLNPEILAEFTLGAGEDCDVNPSLSAEKYEDSNSNKDDEGKSRSISGYSSPGEEIVSKRQEIVVCNPSDEKDDKNRKSSLQPKNSSQGKRKVKVDWTPELHRRFVQAVEQLGVDKAVPSRILELMGIECLTRHNIASHLQKYRSHRKHLLAREAEAASWSQRRQMYGGGGGKGEMVSPWLAPTMGFPPMTPPLPHHHHHFRPLHVWGHPTVDQSVVHLWPKRLPHSLSPTQPLPWPPGGLSSPSDSSSLWHPNHQRVQNGVTSGTPCFPQPITTSLSSSPVPGIPPHALYKADDHGNSLAAPAQPPLDFHPTKESVDAVIGDVLSKPWLPLPLGLKPPSLDGVIAELQRQGIPKIPHHSDTHGGLLLHAAPHKSDDMSWH